MKNPQTIYLEHLYHYSCQSCGGWWTVADIRPNAGDVFTCPHCGVTGEVGGIEAAEKARPVKAPQVVETITDTFNEDGHTQATMRSSATLY